MLRRIAILGVLTGMSAAMALFAAAVTARAAGPLEESLDVIVRLERTFVGVTSTDVLGARRVAHIERLDGAFDGWEIVTPAPGVSPVALAAELGAATAWVREAYVSRVYEGLREGARPGAFPAALNRRADPPLQGAPRTGPGVPMADPRLKDAWGLHKSQAPAAWARGATGSRDVIVAVIDSGIDYNHEDLVDNLWRNPTPGPEFGDVGYDFVNNDRLPWDDMSLDFVGHIGHGTHVASIIGATGGNGRGFSGVAPRVSIMSLKFLNSNNRGQTSNAIRAMAYAARHGARVVNCSWGGAYEEGDDALRDAIAALRDQGILVVAAAGNSGGNNDQSGAVVPASFDLDNIISVTKSDRNDELPRNANFGSRSVHLLAPGENVLGAAPNGQYRESSGSSFAVPHVAGAAALLFALRPEWTHREVKAALLETVDPVRFRPDATITRGRLNVDRAVQRALPAPR